jgi:integrase
MRTGELGELPFSVAADLWMELKCQTVNERTGWDYKHYLRALNRFFSQLKLVDIHIGHIVEYRTQRLVSAGPDRINHEVNTLQQMLKMAGLWEPIGRVYKPMKRPMRGPGQAPLDEEIAWMFEVASTRKRWKRAMLCSMLSANTTCGPGEIKNLRLRDIDFTENVFNIVEGAKNEYRERPIPMNTDAAWAMLELLDMARDLGAELPEHYLLPHRAHKRGQKPDPTRPMGSWKKAWYAIRMEASKRYPKLKTLRMYDLRHYAITSLLENPAVSEQTIKDVAGHVSKKILERYSHIRIARKKAALSALEGLRKEPQLQIVHRRESIH